MVVATPDDVLGEAIEVLMPSASQPMTPVATMHYQVEPDGDGFDILEEGDRLARVAQPDEARDLVYVRAHRRAFELASLSGWVRIHGALVDVAGRRALLAGASGVGKTTLAVRMLLDGDAVQGDESVLVRGGNVVAVPRPLHVKPGTERLVPELAGILSGLPRVGGVALLDPGRRGFGWRLREAPLDHVILLGSTSAGPGCLSASQTETVSALVPEAFLLTETKASLLRELTAALARVRCHRLAVGDPAAMRAAVLDAVTGAP